jgi:hypothetical protein
MIRVVTESVKYVISVLSGNYLLSLIDNLS